MKSPDPSGERPVAPRFLDFGPFRVDPIRRQLLRGGHVVELKAKPFDALLVLLAHRGRDLRRQELLREVWPDAIVEENNLSQCISAVRKALGEGPRDHQYVVTVPGLGYRFVAPVVEVAHDSEPKSESVEVEPNRSVANRLGRGWRAMSMLGVLASTVVLLAGLIALGISVGRSVGDSKRNGLEAANPAAREAYLKGRFFWNQRTSESLKRSVTYFEQALAHDSQFALAHSGLADANAMLWEYTSDWQYAVKAQAEAEAAARLDENLAEVLTSRANVTAVLTGDLAAAARDFERAIALDPDYATARHWYAWCLLGQGRLDEATAQLRRAKELDPLSPIITSALGTTFYFAGDRRGAIEQYRRALELDPRFVRAHLLLGQVHTEEGRHPEAIAELETARRLSGDSSEVIGALAYALGRAGRRAEGQEMLETLRAREREGTVPPLAFALAYAGLGDPETARQALDKARNERTVSPAVLRWDPRLSGLVYPPKKN